MQKLGQHFLKNTAVLQVIVDTLEVQKGEAIIEIGPGHGELTMPLIQVVKKFGGTIISIEKDRTLIPALVALSEREKASLFTIVEGDVLKQLPDITGTLHRYKVIGNIPYYITGKLLRVISEIQNKPERTVLLMQKEVAVRICAAPPDMNRLAASVQFWADPVIVASVPKADFSPPPDVESAVIVLQRKKSADGQSIAPEHYYRAVRAIFAQPRKTLLNNLSQEIGKSVKKAQLEKDLEGMGIDPASRPQDLTVERIIAIARASLWG
jgi:16S rRNA (adenine1518-N6/adenine1519-N6)-dimethyltransferase